jgi:hypothetical protein
MATLRGMPGKHTGKAAAPLLVAAANSRFASGLRCAVKLP